MVRHDPKSMSEDELRSFHAEGATDAAESAADPDKFRRQMQSSERLTEYYNQVVAEIRASLDRAEEEEVSSSA
jgi:hypothetical protein